ncbi:MAG: type II toxin-antitoxin system RelE/ParE family toxin [Bacteroidales bacterium]|jgi:mRNA-degrading endonuclease RelE of RelBE toxin-antitoxin system
MKRNYKLKFEKEARADLTNSIKWYNEQKEGLGKYFFNEVNIFLDFIKSHPDACEQKHRNARFLPLKRFPFVIIYTVDDSLKIINIVAVFNTYRNPDKYKNRIND